VSQMTVRGCGAEMGCDISDKCYKWLEIDVLESGQYKISFEYTRLCFLSRDNNKNTLIFYVSLDGWRKNFFA
jgi:hypothetical protein